MNITASLLVARIEYARKQAKRCEERHQQAHYNNDPASAEVAWDRRNRWRGERDAYEKMLYVLKNDPVWLEMFGLEVDT
jgi:neutral trehalase